MIVAELINHIDVDDSTKPRGRRKATANGTRPTLEDDLKILDSLLETMDDGGLDPPAPPPAQTKPKEQVVVNVPVNATEEPGDFNLDAEFDNLNSMLSDLNESMDDFDMCAFLAIFSCSIEYSDYICLGRTIPRARQSKAT